MDPYKQNAAVRQIGGEYTFDGITGYSAGGVPIDARTAYDNCANDYRPAPHIAMPVFSGGARKSKGRKGRKGRKGKRRTQRGGGCGCAGSIAPMRGGGSGNGGFGVMLSNANGKVYDSLNVGACPPPQVGGAAGDPVYSYPAGYTYGPKSFVEAGNGTAHYIDPIGYGSVMTGGKRSGSKRRKSRKSRKSSKGRKH
jgi:hypothetical protein